MIFILPLGLFIKCMSCSRPAIWHISVWTSKLWLCLQKKHSLLFLGGTSGHFLSCNIQFLPRWRQTSLEEGLRGAGWGCDQHCHRKEVGLEQDTWIFMPQQAIPARPFPRATPGQPQLRLSMCYTTHTQSICISTTGPAKKEYAGCMALLCQRSFCAAKPPWASLLQAAGSKFLWTESVKWPCWGWDVWEAEAVRLQSTSAYFKRKPPPSWRRKPV